MIAVKMTVQGLLIYVAMAEYLLAFVAMVLARRRLGWILYAAGFVAAATAVVYRAVHVGHVPLQNLFDVFLALGMLMPLLSLFCRRVLHVGGESADAIIAMGVLFPAGFVERFSEALVPLRPALQSPLFVPHVAVYLAAYVIMAKAAVAAVAVILGGRTEIAPGSPGPSYKKKGTFPLLPANLAMHRLVCMGMGLLTAGLILGAMWGKRAWGDWWNWDPKEMWSLACWLVYVGYFHFRVTFRRRNPRAEAGFVVAGIVFIIITLLWANLSRLFAGLHSYA